MKPKIFSITLMTLGITLGTMSLLLQPSYGSDTTFTCEGGVDERGGQIDTLLISPPYTSDISLMQFKTPAFSNWRNNQGQNYYSSIRCEEVKTKLQRYFDCNSNENPLDTNFLAAATFPWQEVYYPVILTTLNPAAMSRECLKELADTNPKVRGLLFMLPPEQDINQAAAKAKDALDKLEDLRFYAVGDAIEN
jgi:hypothetical protein